MQNYSNKPISLKFLFFVVVIIGVIVYYLSIPREKPLVKTYEELLEQRITPPAEVITQKSSNQINSFEDIPTQIPVQQKTVQETLSYNELLNILKDYPVTSEAYITNIVNKLIEYKGYKAGTIEVKVLDNYQDNSQLSGSEMVANFDFKTGNLYISKRLITTTDKKIIIAIIVHELDHFDTLAKICKYMGTEKFKELFEKNRIPNIDSVFWSKVSERANLKDFNGEYYKEALERFLTQNDLELLSSYSDFYKLAENMRNPLEIKAYEESDYVYKYYNIAIEEGPMRKITKKFNEADWAIYNEISKYPLLEKERISAFDYFFMKAIINNFPELKEVFNRCNLQKDGDLTEFWLAFENKFKNFYSQYQIDNNTFETMYKLLADTEAFAKNGFNIKDGAEFIKYKINTLLTNLVYPNAIKNLQSECLNYLKIYKEYGIQDEKEELKIILTLICIENNLYKNNQKDISLYYIKIPNELLSLYNADNKRQFLLNLYKTEYFKSQKGSASESQYLIKLINEARLDKKVKD